MNAYFHALSTLERLARHSSARLRHRTCRKMREDFYSNAHRFIRRQICSNLGYPKSRLLVGIPTVLYPALDAAQCHGVRSILLQAESKNRIEVTSIHDKRRTAMPENRDDVKKYARWHAGRIRRIVRGSNTSIPLRFSWGRRNTDSNTAHRLLTRGIDDKTILGSYNVYQREGKIARPRD